MTYFFAVSGPANSPDLDMMEVSEDGTMCKLVAYVSTQGGGGEGNHVALGMYVLHSSSVGVRSDRFDLPGDTSYSDATQTLYTYVLVNPTGASEERWRNLITYGSRLTIQEQDP